MTTRLIDPFNRAIEYVRLSVTDRCDLRCSYCLPKDHDEFIEPENWLRFLVSSALRAPLPSLACGVIRSKDSAELP